MWFWITIQNSAGATGLAQSEGSRELAEEGRHRSQEAECWTQLWPYNHLYYKNYLAKDTTPVTSTSLVVQHPRELYTD